MFFKQRCFILCGVVAVRHIGLVCQVLIILFVKIRFAIRTRQTRFVIKCIEREHGLQNGESPGAAVKNADRQLFFALPQVAAQNLFAGTGRQV